jgi:hypothetical protein
MPQRTTVPQSHVPFDVPLFSVNDPGLLALDATRKDVAKVLAGAA